MIRDSATAGSALGEILELYEYNRWASHRLFDAVSRLTSEELARDLGSSFPSVLETLVQSSPPLETQQAILRGV